MIFCDNRQQWKANSMNMMSWWAHVAFVQMVFTHKYKIKQYVICCAARCDLKTQPIEVVAPTQYKNGEEPPCVIVSLCRVTNSIFYLVVFVWIHFEMNVGMMMLLDLLDHIYSFHLLNICTHEKKTEYKLPRNKQRWRFQFGINRCEFVRNAVEIIWIVLTLACVYANTNILCAVTWK